MVCVVVGMVSKRRLRHIARPFSTYRYAKADKHVRDTIPMLSVVQDNASAIYHNQSYQPAQHQHQQDCRQHQASTAMSVYHNQSYQPAQYQHQQDCRQHQHHHYTAGGDSAALADDLLDEMDHNNAELAEAEFSAYPTAGAASLVLNTIPGMPTFSAPRQHPRMIPTADLARFHDSRTLHPSLQLSSGVHGHASLPCKLEFADNVHNVDVHAQTVGAMHPRMIPTADLARFHDSRTLHPSLQLSSGVHGHASSPCKLEFADNVHNVDVHAQTVGAMHPRMIPTADLARFHDSRTLHPSLQLSSGVHGHASLQCNLEFADNVHNVDVHAQTVGAMHPRMIPTADLARFHDSRTLHPSFAAVGGVCTGMPHRHANWNSRTTCIMLTCMHMTVGAMHAHAQATATRHP